MTSAEALTSRITWRLALCGLVATSLLPAGCSGEAGEACSPAPIWEASGELESARRELDSGSLGSSTPRAVREAFARTYLLDGDLTRAETDLIFNMESEDSDDVWSAVEASARRDAEGDLGARYALARMYELGFTADGMDWNEAVALYQSAAEEGHDGAAGRLGALLLSGLYGVQPDVERGEPLLRRAASAGHRSSQRALGLELLTGVNLSPNLVEGLRLIGEAADAGDFESLRFLLVNCLHDEYATAGLDCSQSTIQSRIEHAQERCPDQDSCDGLDRIEQELVLLRSGVE